MGSEILDQDAGSHGGPYYTGVGCNSMYANYRGTLVYDGKADFSGTTDIAPVLFAPSQTAYYQPRILGRSGHTQAIAIWCYVDFLPSSAGTVTISCAINGTSQTATVAISTTTTGWVELLVAAAKPQITDTTETEQFELSYTVDSGTWTRTRVEACHIFYEVSSTALPAVTAGDDGYQPSGFVPFDDQQFTGEKPRSTASNHHLHRDLEYFYDQRVGNIASGGNMSPGAPTQQTSTIFTDMPPDGVLSAKFRIKTSAATTTTVTVLGGSGDTASVATSTTWASLTVDVLPGIEVAFLVETASGSVYLTDVSAYWEDI
jgi:hypothetical protein